MQRYFAIALGWWLIPLAAVNVAFWLQFGHHFTFLIPYLTVASLLFAAAITYAVKAPSLETFRRRMVRCVGPERPAAYSVGQLAFTCLRLACASLDPLPSCVPLPRSCTALQWLWCVTTGSCVCG